MLIDSDIMPWGKHKGRQLHDVPTEYWQWLLAQEGFNDNHPDLARYASMRTTAVSWDEALRMIRRS